MFCRHCGAEVGKAEFCPGCGKAQIESVESRVKRRTACIVVVFVVLACVAAGSLLLLFGGFTESFKGFLN